MKQEIDCYINCADFDRTYGIHHKMRVYFGQDKYNPSGRFNIREYPPQTNILGETGKVSKVWNTVFCDHATLAPTSPRLIDELLCNEFKRK